VFEKNLGSAVWAIPFRNDVREVHGSRLRPFVVKQLVDGGQDFTGRAFDFGTRIANPSRSRQARLATCSICMPTPTTSLPAIAAAKTVPMPP
jgi:hypothetical protein